MILQKDKYSFTNYAIYVVACSVMGKGKIENQDSVEIRKMNNGLIVAVADGLGSASYSKEGSECAVKVVSELLGLRFTAALPCRRSRLAKRSPPSATPPLTAAPNP